MNNHLRTAIPILALILSIACLVAGQGSPAAPSAVESPLTPPPPENGPTGASPTSAPTAGPTLPARPTRLNASGPYVLFGGSAGIWITNPDGSFPTQLSTIDVTTDDLHELVSPAGDHLAVVGQDEQGLDLYLIDIPDGRTQKIAHLLDLTSQDLLDATSPRAITSYAISGYSNVAWNPVSGSQLAFTGAVNGPTSDLYLYDLQNGEVTQLTSGASQAILPSWSPDGKYILHYGVSWVPPFGGAILGYNRIDGAWAVRVSDGKILPQPKPKDKVNFVGWQDDRHYLIYDSDETCYSVHLRNVDVTTGEATPFMDWSFYYGIAQSPENMALLFSGAAGCPSSPGEGLFLLPPNQSTPAQLSDKKAYDVSWLPESGVFQAYPEGLVSSDGSIRYAPPVYDHSFHPAVSKKGYPAWEVIENTQGRVEVLLPGGSWQTLLKGAVDELIWDPVQGDTLLISLDDGSLVAAAFPDFTPRSMGDLGGRVSQAIWIP